MNKTQVARKVAAFLRRQKSGWTSTGLSHWLAPRLGVPAATVRAGVREAGRLGLVRAYDNNHRDYPVDPAADVAGAYYHAASRGRRRSGRRRG